MLITLFRDKLPNGLCFPLGQEILAKAVYSLDLAIVFVWQSTWASQILDPVNGERGEIVILNVGAEAPRMRINVAKVRPIPPEAQFVVTEFASASDRRQEVLEAFHAHGARLVSKRLAERAFQPFQLRFNIEAKRLHLSAKKVTTTVG
jgi:hypothetical protein